MRHWLSITVGIYFLALVGPIGAETIRLNYQPDQLETNYSTISETHLTINIGEMMTVESEGGYRLEMPEALKIGSGAIPGPGNTLLPTYSTLVAIPENARLSFAIIQDENVVLYDFQLAEASQADRDWLNQAVGYAGGKYPQDIIKFEYAGKMRDLNLARLTIFPVQYDYGSHDLTIHNNIEIKLNHPGGEILPPDGTVSEAFLPIYKALITNDDIIGDVQMRRGAYWFIGPSALISATQPLIDWKRAQGFAVRVIPTSEIGSNPNCTAIKNFIVTQYNSAEIKPDYICLVGDVNTSTGVDTYTQPDPYSGWAYIDSDNYYTFMDDNDYFPEFFIGRISVGYAYELTNYLNKYFQYARNPYMDDVEWYRKATMVAGSNYQSPRLTKLWCREMLLSHGYAQVDTFLSGYDNPTSINNKINQGLTWVNYRGYGAPEGWSSPYYTTSNVYQLSNGPRFAIMTSIVCGTGDYNNYSECLGEAWIKYANRGGPGFIGTTNPDTHTQWNNAIDCGIYWGMMQEQINGLAQLELIGKMNMYYAFPEDTYPGGRIEWYFNSYNDLGDPALSCWTKIPEQMQVAHIVSAPIGSAGIMVTVADSQSEPLENAYVCLWDGNDIFQGKFADANGQAAFQIEATESDSIAVTVTKANYIPYEGTIAILGAEVAVGIRSWAIDDDMNGNSSGNDDGFANPVEIVEINPALVNFGSSETAANVTAEMMSDNPYIEVTASQASFGDIAPGDSSHAQVPFVIEIAADAPDSFRAEMMLTISDDSGNVWHNFIFLPILAVDLNLTSTSIQNDANSNGFLDRGEAGDLVLSLMNNGSIDGHSIQAILRTTDSLIVITDSLGSFGDINIGGTANNLSDPFSVIADSEVYDGHYIDFELILACGSGQVQQFHFDFMVSQVNAIDPIGPDDYGYYCFDNTDVTYEDYPIFNWINIETNWDVVSVPDDHISIRNLPFEVRFYGQTYSTFSISDNGYIALGQSWWSNFLNTNIPSPQCAPAMVAPFWDDLSNNGGPTTVRYHYDQENGKFIIGWANARSNDTYGYQDFEIIILDNQIWPTRTGDNDIIFQYNRVTSAYSNSIGICGGDRANGIQYVFNSAYNNGAAPLIAGRAIKFTTGSDYLVGIDDESGNNLPLATSLAQNYPNPFNPSTNINYRLSAACDVRLDIFDILGRNVRTLVNRYEEVGYYSVIWDSRDYDGRSVAAGIYLYKLQAGDTELANKMILLK